MLLQGRKRSLRRRGTTRLWISIQALHINARTGQLGVQITVKTGQAARITATATAVGRDSHRRVVHLVVHRLNGSRHEIAVGYRGCALAGQSP